LSASSARQLIGLVSRAILSAHCQPHNLVAAIIVVAHKQAARGVATMLTSTNEIASVATSYFCATSLLHVSINVRETMWWWLAVARRKIWWWIVLFGYSYSDDVLQDRFAVQPY
jgi:hypothetical protein